MRVKNISTSIVTLPFNDPADVCTAALQAGLKSLVKTSFCTGNEEMVAVMQGRPELFVCPGSYRAKVVELKPGQEGEIEPKTLLPRAKAIFDNMVKPGGSLIVCS
jgi:hypothetical protein